MVPYWMVLIYICLPLILTKHLKKMNLKWCPLLNVKVLCTLYSFTMPASPALLSCRQCEIAVEVLNRPPQFCSLCMYSL